MPRTVELRLVGAPLPAGQIAVTDLAAIGSALQELTTRIGREVLGASGPGRTKRFMEELSSLRLQQLTSGSTVLSFVKEPLEKLDVDLPQIREADNRFWEIMRAVSENHRPPWVPDGIAQSAAKLISALKNAAPVAILGDASDIEVQIDCAEVRAEMWVREFSLLNGVADAVGLLEKIDLRSHDFRVRDDIGQAVELKHVLNDANAARLVGHWVIAHGEGTVDASGRVVSLSNVTIESVVDPAVAYLGGEVAKLDEILASAPGPDFGGGIALTDEEFDDFLRASHS